MGRRDVGILLRRRAAPIHCRQFLPAFGAELRKLAVGKTAVGAHLALDTAGGGFRLRLFRTLPLLISAVISGKMAVPFLLPAVTMMGCAALRTGDDVIRLAEWLPAHRAVITFIEKHVVPPDNKEPVWARKW